MGKEVKLMSLQRYIHQYYGPEHGAKKKFCDDIGIKPQHLQTLIQRGRTKILVGDDGHNFISIRKKLPMRDEWKKEKPAKPPRNIEKFTKHLETCYKKNPTDAELAFRRYADEPLAWFQEEDVKAAIESTGFIYRDFYDLAKNAESARIENERRKNLSISERITEDIARERIKNEPSFDAIEIMNPELKNAQSKITIDIKDRVKAWYFSYDLPFSREEYGWFYQDITLSSGKKITMKVMVYFDFKPDFICSVYAKDRWEIIESDIDHNLEDLAKAIYKIKPELVEIDFRNYIE